MLGLTVLMGCDPSETLARYGGRDYVWRLIEVDHIPARAPVTLTFGFHGTVSGIGPCGPYGARLVVPHPWFELNDVHSETSECNGSGPQQTYLTALQSMTLGEVSGQTLILSNDAGREMVFTAISSAD